MFVDGMAVNECNRNIVFACECVHVRLCFVCGACIQEHSCMCGWCLLVKTACTYLPCGHLIGVVCSGMWCVRVCVNACKCVLHTLRTHLMHSTSQTVPAETGRG